ncbi:MAG: hypothetical protein ACE5NJ_05205 [Thermodesulfobacteriota bacterium]
MFIPIVGILCLLYLGTTRTTEDQRLIDALMKYCYTHYALVKRPTPKNETRFLRYEAELAQLSEGKFDHLKEDEVKAFLEPRGYAYEVEEGDGRVDYLLARFVEHGQFEASGSDCLSYDYFLLDRFFVVPYDRSFFGGFMEEADRSPLIFHSTNGRVYINAAWARWRFEKLFTRLWESKVTRVSKTKGPRHYRVLYRGVKDIWREARLFRRSERASREYFIEHAFESHVPTVLGCVSREYYYRNQKLSGTNGLVLGYLRSLAEDPNFITLGFLCYQDEEVRAPWAGEVIKSLEAQGWGNWALRTVRSSRYVGQREGPSSGGGGI